MLVNIFISFDEKLQSVFKNKSVQLPTSADNTALLAVAAERPPDMQQSIDIACPPGPQQQTRRPLLQRSINGTGRLADTVPLRKLCRTLCHQCHMLQCVN